MMRIYPSKRVLLNNYNTKSQGGKVNTGNCSMLVLIHRRTNVFCFVLKQRLSEKLHYPDYKSCLTSWCSRILYLWKEQKHAGETKA